MVILSGSFIIELYTWPEGFKINSVDDAVGSQYPDNCQHPYSIGTDLLSNPRTVQIPISGCLNPTYKTKAAHGSILLCGLKKGAQTNYGTL